MTKKLSIFNAYKDFFILQVSNFRVITVVGISILVGSMVSTKKIKKNGLMNGGLVGFIYVIILYLASSLCLVGFSLTLQSFILLAVAMVTGMIGGIIGVNLNRKI